jgi:serine/threonine protein phosphatase 1
MRKYLKSVFGSQALNVPRIPHGRRVYAIGDIHGRLDLLKRLHQNILDDAQDAFEAKMSVTIIYLGDYIDRGPSSKGVIDYITGNWPGDVTSVFLRGNHEVTLLDFLDDPNVLNAWRNFGGLETLFSYGVDVTRLRQVDGLSTIQSEFRRLMPLDHLQFYQNLQTTAMIGGYFFVHAGVKPGVPLDRQNEDDLLWIREEFLESDRFHEKVVVHGHTPNEQPEICTNRINIDTGAYLTGKLTCLVLQGKEQKIL